MDSASGDSGVVDAGPEVESVGNDTLVTIAAGSLSAERPTDDAGRFEALVSYLRSDPMLFGAPGVDPASLTFAEAVPQSQIIDEAGQVYTAVSLHQTFMNAPVIDETQMAMFLSTPGGDELRRVRAHLRDPSALPTPPDPALMPPDDIDVAVADLIALHDLSADATAVGDTPAIVARDDIAGYPVTQVVAGETGSLGRFAAVIDPRDLRVTVVEKRPPCDALRPVPPEATVVEVPHDGFTIPGLPDLRTIRIQALVMGDDNLSNVSNITREQIRIWVDEANKVWVPQARIAFLFDDSPGSADVERWSSTTLNHATTNETEDLTYAAVANLLAQTVYPHRLVVIFRKFDNPGFSWGPLTNSFVSMPQYTTGGIWKPDSGGVLRNDTLLSHEIGHYMGLSHTFGGGACSTITPLTSDGDAAGQEVDDPLDDVIDTESDMSDACYATDSLMCTGGLVIFNDLTWDPPWTNVMSYHDCIPEDLSAGQVGVINHILTHPNRSVLID